MSNSLHIGSAIKIFRVYNKMTQPAFAAKLHKALPTIKKYEADDILVPLDILDDICNILHISLDQLWFLSRLNRSENLRQNIIAAFNKLDLQAVITDNGFVVVNSFITEEPICVAKEYNILKGYINTLYCDFVPISSIVPQKIIYLAVVKYWQNDVLPQIKKALAEHSKRASYEQWTKDLEQQMLKETQGLELLKNILINTNNHNNELQHVIPLLEQLNQDLAKII